MHKLGKVRNANRVLNDLSLYLSSFREEYDTIYYLNKLGREYVNSKKVRRKNSFVQHVKMRNDFYIYMGYPTEWKNEIKFRDGKNKYSLVCDAWFKKNGKYQFLEVDHIQKMKENKSKLENYKGLHEALVGMYGYFPKINWLTTTELRRKQLQNLCEGLPCEIFTLNDIK